MRVMIHACLKREWYARDYLIPSIKAQGLNNVEMWLDRNEHGCLKSCIESFESCKGLPGSTWHLQDDVLVCHDFAERVKSIKHGLACGFCFERFESRDIVIGETIAAHMWESSFPCIKIPNELAWEFSRWIHACAQDREDLAPYIETNKKDDTLFRIFMLEKHFSHPVYNVAPHLVEHIDHLIGGSVINQWRGYIVRGTYFEDHYLETELQNKLASR